MTSLVDVNLFHCRNYFMLMLCYRRLGSSPENTAGEQPVRIAIGHREGTDFLLRQMGPF